MLSYTTVAVGEQYCSNVYKNAIHATPMAPNTQKMVIHRNIPYCSASPNTLFVRSTAIDEGGVYFFFLQNIQYSWPVDFGFVFVHILFVCLLMDTQ